MLDQCILPRHNAGMSRTTLDLDEELVRQTLEATGKTTKKAAIEEAMRELIKARLRERLLERIKSGDLGLDLTMDDLRKLRGRE
jgi:Arc/MetJ family transcription regulator